MDWRGWTAVIASVLGAAGATTGYIAQAASLDAVQGQRLTRLEDDQHKTEAAMRRIEAMFNEIATAQANMAGALGLKTK